MNASAATPLQDDRFLLLQAIGRGAMGAVYRAFDRIEQRLVALKVPRPGHEPGPDHPLASEFETWSRLRHPNIVRVYELGHARSGPLPLGTPYLVLEHVDGGPVHRILQPGRVGPPLAEAVALQLLQALDHVHSSGFVHRDLKPGNVLVPSANATSPTVRLTDFGLAAPLGVSRRAGVFSGSLPYVAPEALLGLPLDGRTDLYGLGILLYHLVTGRMPVPEGGPEAILRWHLNGPPADPAGSRPDVPDRLARFVRRLTARDPDERPRSASEAMRLLGGRAPTPGPAASLRAGASCRAERARVRLALDAARLGEDRLFELPDDAAAAAALTADVAVWSQVRGLALHRLPSATNELERFVLRLALERGAAGVALLRRHGLARSLPLDWLGELPIPDGGPARDGRAEARATGAFAFSEFLLGCAREQPFVLGLPPEAGADRLVRELTRRLVETCGSPRRGERGRGGLLILVSRRRDRAGPRRRGVSPGLPR